MKKGFWAEFKEFINQGNVMDLAVAVVIGGAFTAIVNSVVNDLIMPLISLFTGGIDFSAMKVTIGAGENAAAFTYGNFISAVIQFLVIAFVVFCMVRALNQMKKVADESNAAIAEKLGRHSKGTEEAEEEPHVPTCPYCLEEVKEGSTRCSHCAGVFDEPAK